MDRVEKRRRWIVRRRLEGRKIDEIAEALQVSEKTENTGYAQAIKIAMKDLYAIDSFDRNTWKPLKEAMEKLQQPGLHRWILKAKAGIDICVTDLSTTDVDRDLQVPVMNFDNYAIPTNRNDVSALSTRTGVSIHSLDDLLDALETEFLNVAKQIVGVKTALAYLRDLDFEKTTHAEAETVFNRIYRTTTFQEKEVMPHPGIPIVTYVPRGIGFEEAKPLQDYVVHRIIQLAEKKDSRCKSTQACRRATRTS